MVKKTFTLGISFVYALSLLVAFGQSVNALDNTYPDQSDTSGAASTYVVSAQTQFVQRTDNNLRVWFPTNSGTVTITNGHYCTSNVQDTVQSGDHFASTAIPNAAIITNFQVGSSTQYGRKYAAGAASCNNVLTFPVSGLVAQENGFYYANIDITYNTALYGGTCSGGSTAGCDGIMNYFRIASTAGSYIGVRTPPSGGTGYDATEQQVDTSPSYTTYYAPFGTPCAIAANQVATLTFFDLDNAGGSGAQPAGQDITVALEDLTTSTYVNFIGPAGTVWTPPSLDNTAQSITFTAQPLHKYRLEIRDVYYNNTIQYSVPYSQIYRFACPPPPPPPVPGAYSVVATGTNHEKGDPASKFITYTLNVAASACVGAATVVWGGDNAANTTTVLANCGAVGTYSWTSNAITAATLDAQPPGAYGAYSGRIATVNGAASVIVSPTSANISIYEVPYLRIYGNDVSAAGCVDPRGSIVDGRPNAGNLYGGITASRRTMEVAYPATSAAPDPRTVYTGAGGNVYAGAAVEYAAIALTTRSNTILNGSFQNHTSSPIRLQAFWSAGNRTCPDTVYSKISGVESLPGIVDATIVAGGTISNMGSLAAGDNYYARASGNVTIDNPGASVSTSGKYTIYANGDVRITDNIIATKPAPFSNTTATVTLIIASGSIYIDPGVTQVDAVLVAQNDIYSCGSGGFGGQAQNTVHTNCRSKLTINGALNARYVHLQRSIGTRLLAPNNEQSTTAGGNAAAAEAINYPYYLYFTTPYLADKAESTFQSYFSPAPYF